MSAAGMTGRAGAQAVTWTPGELAPHLAPREVQFWGHSYPVTPVLVEQTFGDGRQLIRFQPLNTRPNWYVVRVDSAWNLSNWSDAPELFVDHTDEVYEALREQFGDREDEDEEGEPCFDEWPALSASSGSGWGLIAEKLGEF